MPVVSAFLVPGTPLPYLRPDNPPWRELDAGLKAAGRALAASKPDVIAVYSTQWIAVLDELWQTRPRIQGVHVDENWHEYGDLPFDIKTDVRLAKAAIDSTASFGVRSKPVDYDGFPIDTGTIVANHYLNPNGKLPLVIAANNVYHDWQTTEKLAATVVACADKLKRRVALVAVGGLSGSIIRADIDLAQDRIASVDDDRWNRRMLECLRGGNAAAIAKLVPKYAAAARVDMGFKHLAWILGGLGARYRGAQVHCYGPSYGSGAAVVEFVLGPARPAKRRSARKGTARGVARKAPRRVRVKSKRAARR